MSLQKKHSWLAVSVIFLQPAQFIEMYIWEAAFGVEYIYLIVKSDFVQRMFLFLRSSNTKNILCQDKH